MTNNDEDQDLTEMLEAAANGDEVAREEFVNATYRKLHSLAARILNVEAPGPTLQPTYLVNEALLRLFGRRPLRAENRKHFLSIAARQMRRVLVDRARARHSDKRKGAQIGLEDAGQISMARSPELVALDDALNALAEMDPSAADVVEKKFFGGYTDEETAAILDVHVSRVRRDWTYARAWLHDYLAKE